MFTLIVGSAASGKSAFAEEIALALPGERLYLATMEPWGTEGTARVEKHRQARAGRGFRTVERNTALDGLSLPPDASVLLEDLGNLTANELFHTAGGGAEAVLSGLDHLTACSRNLTVVSNEVFSAGRDYEGDTLRYLKTLAQIHRTLAARADRVVEVVCGLPDVWKGDPA